MAGEHRHAPSTLTQGRCHLSHDYVVLLGALAFHIGEHSDLHSTLGHSCDKKRRLYSSRQGVAHVPSKWRASLERMLARYVFCPAGTASLKPAPRQRDMNEVERGALEASICSKRQPCAMGCARNCT